MCKHWDRSTATRMREEANGPHASSAKGEAVVLRENRLAFADIEGVSGCGAVNNQKPRFARDIQLPSRSRMEFDPLECEIGSSDEQQSLIGQTVRRFWPSDRPVFRGCNRAVHVKVAMPSVVE